MGRCPTQHVSINSSLVQRVGWAVSRQFCCSAFCFTVQYHVTMVRPPDVVIGCGGHCRR